ncbi:MAG: sulfatase [Planctomycetota bacterium]
MFLSNPPRFVLPSVFKPFLRPAPLASFVLLVFLLCLLNARIAAQETDSTERPNVLFIAVDDLNDWIRCMGGRAGVSTPHLDRLAACGVLFTNAHCAAPSCNPSRVAVMTGVAPHHSGIYNNSQDWRMSGRLSDASTIPEHFRQAGYRAIGGGKIFHALSWIKDGYGQQQNDPKIWDDYFPSATDPMPPALWPKGANAKTNAAGYTNWKAIAQAEDQSIRRPAHFWDWAPYDEPESESADSKVVDWATRELAKDSQTPVFQAVGIFRPHIPWFAPRKYFDLYPIEGVKLPKILKNDLADTSAVGQGFCRRQWQDWAVKTNMWRGAVQGYLASISFADAQIGRLLDSLDASPRAKNTIVVLWSDHGMHIGEKEHWEKFTLWEESTRVPLMIVAPGVTQAGGVCKQPVSLLDIYPTLNELCGLAPIPGLDGQSLMSLLRDPSSERVEPAITTWGQRNFGIRDERFRLIQYHNGDQELYDHYSDPDEFHNLLHSEPEKWTETISRLAGWIPELSVAPIQREKKAE